MDKCTYNRRSIRFHGYDYTQPGYYFITICTKNRENLFGKSDNDSIVLNEYGAIVHDRWKGIPAHFPLVRADDFVVMPDHIHGILVIEESSNLPRQEKFGKPVAGSIPTIVRSFKSAVTRQINILRGTPGCVVWQRNYFEKIIYDDASLSSIREYIRNNPVVKGGGRVKSLVR